MRNRAGQICGRPVWLSSSMISQIAPTLLLQHACTPPGEPCKDGKQRALLKQYPSRSAHVLSGDDRSAAKQGSHGLALEVSFTSAPCLTTNATLPQNSRA